MDHGQAEIFGEGAGYVHANPFRLRIEMELSGTGLAGVMPDQVAPNRIFDGERRAIELFGLRMELVAAPALEAPGR